MSAFVVFRSSTSLGASSSVPSAEEMEGEECRCAPPTACSVVCHFSNPPRLPVCSRISPLTSRMRAFAPSQCSRLMQGCLLWRRLGSQGASARLPLHATKEGGRENPAVVETIVRDRGSDTCESTDPITRLCAATTGSDPAPGRSTRTPTGASPATSGSWCGAALF